MKLLQIIITAFMFGATCLTCWIFYNLNKYSGEWRVYEQNAFLRQSEFGFYILIAVLGLALVVGLIVQATKKTWDIGE